MQDNILREKEIAFGLLSDYINCHNMRSTRERQLILETIFDLPPFFEANTLHTETLKRLNVSLATIYSSLELFQECGLVVRHNFSSRLIRYERNSFSQDGTYYKICIGCHKIKKFKDSKLNKSIALRNNKAFYSIKHTLYLYGYCKKCQNKRLSKK